MSLRRLDLLFRLAALLVLAHGLLPLPVSGAEPPSDPGVASPRVLEVEEPDNPPGKYVARANPFARSPSLPVAFGHYTSIQINVDGFGQNIVGDAANETSIAVNPVNPLNMVVGWRQFDTVTSNFRKAGWGYTFDGGATWTFPGSLEESVFRTDPVLDVDSNGLIYYQSIDGNLDAFIFRSPDGGQLWRFPVYAYGGDKNWMVVDRSGGTGEGHIYGIWQRFYACCGLNVLTRSTDGGASYETPVPVVSWPTFGTMAVGPNGDLYATGIEGITTQDLDHFVVARSVDARNPAATPTFTGGRVDLGGSMVAGTGPNPVGLLGQGNVAVDRSGGPTNGNVYVLASVAPPGGGDPTVVNLIRSTDGGATWSPPVRVNDDPVGSGHWHWFAAHSVAPNGRIDVIWNDTRNSGMMNISQLFYAYSWDAGTTWSPNVAVSPPFDSSLGYPQQSKIGDYYSLVSNATGADVAYAATFNGEQDVYYLRVYPDCNENGISDVTDIAGGSSPDADGDHVPDECQTPVCVGAGAVTIAGVGKAALTVTELPNGDLSLAWGASCHSGDTDYAVYEGTVGNFTSRTTRFCSTGGLTGKVLVPGGGNMYYLVVPSGGGWEGSYGKNSAGQERPQAPGACFPQQVCACDPGS